MKLLLLLVAGFAIVVLLMEQHFGFWWDILFMGIFFVYCIFLGARAEKKRIERGELWNTIQTTK